MRKKFRLMSLSAAGRRVRIAKDVIKLLKSKHIEATHGTYIALGRSGGEYPDPLKQLDQVIEQNKGRSNCQVCAIGALLVADVMLRDKMMVKDIGSGSGLKQRLRRHFGLGQLGLIESAFEGSMMGYSHDCYKAIDFGRQHKRGLNRLKAIMRNIIRNRGNFKP